MHRYFLSPSPPPRTQGFGWFTLVCLMEKRENQLGVNLECQVWMKTPGRSYVWFHLSGMEGVWMEISELPASADILDPTALLLNATLWLPTTLTQRWRGQAKVRETQDIVTRFSGYVPSHSSICDLGFSPHLSAGEWTIPYKIPSNSKISFKLDSLL